MIKIYGILKSTKSIDGLLKRIARHPEELDENANEMIQRAIPFHRLREYFCKRVYILFGKKFPIKDIFYIHSKKLEKPTNSNCPIKQDKGIKSLKVDSKKIEHFLSDLKFKDPEENKKPTPIARSKKVNPKRIKKNNRKLSFWPIGRKKKGKRTTVKYQSLDPNSSTYQSDLLKQELKNKYKDYEYGLSDW